MGVLMLHNHIPKIVSNQKNKKFVSLFSTPIAGKTIVVVGTGNLGARHDTSSCSSWSQNYWR